MSRFWAALSFLTIVPLPQGWGAMAGAKDAFQRSTPFFPIVGVLMGAGMWGMGLFLLPRFPQPVVGWLLVLAMVAVSGGLHLDGLADTADGFLSSRPREQILEIMKDSRIGTMGALALVGVLGLKATALGYMPADSVKVAAFMGPVAGRCAMTMLMVALPHARPEGGLGSAFVRQPIIGGWALVCLLATGWLAGGKAGLAVGGLVLVAVAILAWRSYRKIGGVTGDVLGASGEIAEAAVALAFSFLTGADGG